MKRKRATPISPTPSYMRRYATAVLASEVLRDVARVLDASGIRVMPLKGVLFQLLLYPDPAQRALTDVDILVPEQDFERAIVALVQAGFQPRGAGPGLIECAFRAPRGLTVDLHRRLFGNGRYKLSTEALFRRAIRNDSLLGVPLYLAHPHDTAAHLIGKFVSDHERFEVQPRLAELAQWVRHCAIDPVRLGRHLRACGMRRAGHYVLSRGAELLEDPFFRAALVVSPAGKLDRVYTRIARVLMRDLRGTVLASLPAHLLNASLAQGAMSATLVVAHRLKHAWWTRRRGAHSGYWAPFFVPSRRQPHRSGAASPRSASAALALGASPPH
ncbi:MAG: nucleotidyltransferase family protein [Deltaproteobacteria bacterium]